MSLTPEDIRKHLAAQASPIETLHWLNSEFIPEIITRFNTTDVRRRLGLYAGEKIPENERNLTDVRNRVSLIIEYEMARIATRVLEDHGIQDIFWSYVVANRFPDLEVRNVRGERGLRIEVKCLQTVAEEKSANFDTLRKDVHPGTDYIAAFLWEWGYDPCDIAWNRAPVLHQAFVFHASSIALLRDCYWLNSPPGNLGGGLQGFDLRYAVNCNAGQYNEEEGNYGKLLRLWKEGFEFTPTNSELVERTISDYLLFKREAISLGFDSLAHLLLPGLSGDTQIQAVTAQEQRIGWQAGNVCFLLDPSLPPRNQRRNLASLLTANKIYILKEKYNWILYELNNGIMTQVSEGRKPKHITQGQA